MPVPDAAAGQDDPNSKEADKGAAVVNDGGDSFTDGRRGIGAVRSGAGPLIAEDRRSDRMKKHAAQGRHGRGNPWDPGMFVDDFSDESR
jgi:hypothetical protein